MPMIKLMLSDDEMSMLNELCDFEGEEREGTIRLCLKYHHAHMRMILLEIDHECAKKISCAQTSGDDEVPY